MMRSATRTIEALVISLPAMRRPTSSQPRMKLVPPAGASATAECDLDCSLPVCGDGLRNAAAGEACDSIIDATGCDADCTLPVCGDGHRNANLEG